MKSTLTALTLCLSAVLSLAAAIDPILRNPITTATPLDMTNVVISIASGVVVGGTNTTVYNAGTGITMTTSGTTNTFSLYSGPTISSFSPAVPILENGATATTPVLNWVLAGGAITFQSIDQGIGSVNIALRTKTDPQSYTTNRTYTLMVTDGRTTNTLTTSVLFEDKLYHGVSANTSLTDGQIIALTSGFATSRVITFTSSPSAQYTYIAYPASMGAATIWVNGLVNTAWTLTTRAFVNASGKSVSYNIYRANDLFTGTLSISVQ